MEKPTEIGHQKEKWNYRLVIILAVFGIIYSLLSLINHYNFRTNALDLGLYSNQLYNYAHFRMSDYSIIPGVFPHPFADHFDLLLPLLSPLNWIFGTYTLLIVQILAILFGSFGIYTYFKERTDKDYLPELAMIHFLVLWGIYSALSFDYHDNVVGAMFVPWFIHYFDKRNYRLSTLFFVLIIISKENMALWAAFISIGLLLLNVKNKSKLITASIYSACGFFYFYIVVSKIMPSYGDVNGQHGYSHFQYPALGINGWEAIHTIVSKPLYVLKLLFINPEADKQYNDGIKAELHWVILFSGGYALLFRPQYLIMLIPVFGQKLLSNDVSKWGISAQYSIEFVPILSIALFSLIIRIKSQQRALLIATNLTLLAAFTTYTKIENRKGNYIPNNTMFYDKIHYQRDFSVSKINKALKLIPDNVIVSAQSPLIPHLCERETIYMFPDVNNSEYIALSSHLANYPINDDEYKRLLDELLNSPFWETIYNQNSTYIFKRKKDVNINTLILNANDKGVKFRAGLKASNGNIVSLEDDKLIANRSSVGPWEKFQLNIYKNGKLNILSFRFKYVSSDSKLIANRDNASAWENFTIHIMPDNKFAIQNYNGKYIKPNPQNNNLLEATSDTITDKELFEIIPQ